MILIHFQTISSAFSKLYVSKLKKAAANPQTPLNPQKNAPFRCCCQLMTTADGHPTSLRAKRRGEGFEELVELLEKKLQETKGLLGVSGLLRNSITFVNTNCFLVFPPAFQPISASFPQDRSVKVVFGPELGCKKPLKDGLV